MSSKNYAGINKPKNKINRSAKDINRFIAKFADFS